MSSIRKSSLRAITQPSLLLRIATGFPIRLGLKTLSQETDELVVIDPFICLARRGTWASLKLAEIGMPEPPDDLLLNPSETSSRLTSGD